MTFLDAERSVREVSFFCPLRARSVSRAECVSCAECDRFGANGPIGCLHPTAAREIDDPITATGELEQTPLWRVMPSRVVCVRETAGAREAMALLVRLDAATMPVVDQDGCPIGIIAASDLLGRPGSAETVAHRMMCMAFTLPETESVASAAALMECEGVSRIPVVCSRRQVVGVIAARDILGWLVNRDQSLTPAPRLRSARRTLRLATAGGERSTP